MSPRIQFAHKLRGIAALSVVFSHLGYGFWAYEDEVARLIAAPTLAATTALVSLQKMVLPEAFFGHFGVALFFLISGFVVPFALLDRSRRRFAWGRVVRIWPTYAAGLAVTVALIIGSARYFDRPLPFEWTTFVLQMLMIRDIFWVPSIDGIVWTLEIEAKFYLLCLVLASALRRGSAGWLAASGAVLAGLSLGCAFLLPGWLASAEPLYKALYAISLSAQMITFMLIGVAFNLHFRGLLSSWTCCVLSLFFLMLCFIQWRHGPIKSSFMAGSIVYGVALAVFVCSYLARQILSQPSSVLGFFSSISYPLYVVHGVGGYVVMRISIDNGLGAWAATLLAVAYAFCLAWLIHIFVERPTQASRP